MKKVIIPEETLKYVIRTFPYKKDACKYLNVSIDTLRSNINFYGLEYKGNPGGKGKQRKRIASYIDKQWLIDNWVNTNKSMRELALQEGVSESVIDYRRAEYGLVKHFCYPLNECKLFDLTDPHIWYVAGLAATDGYIPRGQNTIEIDLTGESEKKLLKNIHDYYELTNNLYSYGKTTRIRITASGLNDFIFHNFNLVDTPKTFNLRVPANFYSEDCAKAYVRGCLDGDGTIGLNGKYVSILTASESFIAGLNSIICTYVDVSIKYRFESGYPVLSAGSSTGEKVLTWVYSLENCFKLERKYDKYKNRLII